MKVINIDSVENIRVVGFDVFYVDSNGDQQKYSDGLIDIAKGELSVLVNGSELDISKVVDAGENVAESLNNAFLENTISSSQGNTAKKEAESKEEVVDELLEKQLESEKQLEFIQQQLQTRLAEIERLEAQLEEQQEKSEEELEEELLDLEALFPAASAGQIEEEKSEEDRDAVDEEGIGEPVQAIPQELQEDVRPVRKGSPAKIKEIIEPDIIDPVFVDFTLSSGSDSGQKGDLVTNINNSSFSDVLIFEGTGTAGASITLDIGGNKYRAVVDGSGNWSIRTSAELADGDYDVLVTASTPDGGSASQTKNITIDTVAPVAPSVFLSDASDSGDKGDDTTNAVNPTFIGRGEAGSTITLTINNASYTADVAVNGTWEVLVTGALEEREEAYEYTVVAEDAAGNISAEVSSQIIIDTSNVLTGGLDESSNSASINDTITNIASPVFSGTGEVGTTVDLVITIGASAVPYTTAVNEDGSWSIGPVDVIAEDGTYNYTLSSADVAGNDAFLEQEFTLDTSLSVLTAQLKESSDSNFLGDNLTSDNTPTFSGESEPSATIELTINSVVYTAVVDSDGAWLVDVTDALPEGEHGYLVVATDVAGNTLSVTGQSVTIDTIMPTLTGGLSTDSDSGQSSDDGITQIKQPTFSGIGEPEATVNLSIGGVDYPITVGVDGTWEYELPILLADNEYSYTLSSSDAAGNTVVLPVQKLVIDTSTELTVSGLTAATDSSIDGVLSGQTDQLTNIVTPSIEGLGEAGATILLTINGEGYTSTVSDSGQWVVNITNALPEGGHGYHVEATDVAGNTVSVENQSLTIDVSPPSLSSLGNGLDASSDSGSSNSDGTTNDAQPTFSGHSEKNVYIEVLIGGNTYSTTTNDQGEWDVDVTNILAHGIQNYTISAFDAAGNQTDLSNSITVDTQAELTSRLATASDSGSSNSDAITNVDTPTIEGTAGVGDQITLRIGVGANAQVLTTQTDELGNWSIDVPSPLVNGIHSYTVTGLDTAGNEITVSNT
jgi:hypothetical protein